MLDPVWDRVLVGLCVAVIDGVAVMEAVLDAVGVCVAVIDGVSVGVDVLELV